VGSGSAAIDVEGSEVDGEDLPAEGLSVSSTRGKWVLFAMVLGSGIVFLDSTAVNVALPRIGQDFNVGLSQLQWTITAYTLTLSAFLLLGGALGDRYGRRRVFVIGLIWFTAASMLCGVAPSSQWLIAARAAQGIGGALLTPGSLAIIEASFRPDERGRAIGAWSGFGGVFGAVGPLLGGLLVQWVSWRLVFFINVPIAALTVWVVTRHVPESRQAGPFGPLDLRGPILAALGFAGVTYALIEGSGLGWTSRTILVSLGAGVILLGAFLFNEARHPAPVLPLSLFRSRQFVGANGATFAIYAALGAVTFVLVLQLQDALHYSPIEAGVALMPLTLILLSLSSTSGRLADRIGPRLPMTVGPLVAAAGMALFVRVVPGASYVTGVLPGAIVFGLGMVLTVPALTTTALGSVEPDRSGVASAVNNDVARIGSLIAVAVVPTLAALVTHTSGAPSTHQSPEFRAAMLICAALCALGGVVSFVAIRSPRTHPAPDETPFSCPMTGPPQGELARYANGTQAA
jgi:EmrB/QacA subfamily drug resistance transporter